jgi:hypothetical protein
MTSEVKVQFVPSSGFQKGLVPNPEQYGELLWNNIFVRGVS